MPPTRARSCLCATPLRRSTLSPRVGGRRSFNPATRFSLAYSSIIPTSCPGSCCATGSVVPVETIVRLAHAKGAKVLIDGSQAAPRLPVDVQALECDFYAFTGHKVYGPTGIGALYGRCELLAAMPPWQGGGEMILHVSFDKTEYQEPPHRFEAGTPDISGAIGLGAAIDFIEELGRDTFLEHEEALTGYGVDRL